MCVISCFWVIGLFLRTLNRYTNIYMPTSLQWQPPRPSTSYGFDWLSNIIIIYLFISFLSLTVVIFIINSFWMDIFCPLGLINMFWMDTCCPIGLSECFFLTFSQFSISCRHETVDILIFIQFSGLCFMINSSWSLREYVLFITEYRPLLINVKLYIYSHAFQLRV